MQTRSRAREVHEVEDAPEMQVNGAGQAPPRELSPPRVEVPPPGKQAQLNGQASPPPLRTGPPRERPTPRGNHTIDARGSFSLDTGRIRVSSHSSSGPVCGKSSRESTPSFPSPKSRTILGSRGGGAEAGIAVAPPRRSPFAPAILAEALPAGVKVSNLSEYDGTGDPQEHLDKFYAKIHWYDLSDVAYCKVFRTTLSKRALAWFNQLPAGTIFSLEQLTQHFLHHFSMNKRAPKIAAFLFTIRQKENESLRDYMQRFVEAVHEVPHVNHELLASIIQQNLLPGRFKESIAEKPPSTMEDLLMRSQKYIRIEESNASDLSHSVKRKGRRKEKEPKKKEERKHVPPVGFSRYPPECTQGRDSSRGNRA
ncbi:UNVERIFIED_CONTAM: hypothetical protein Slati_3430600 [Sesamum latifolium]|uniref:Retrotransposon gag domain-containing protein n=1 Tax=Sesamum latifolium TaxID=2727402 RepID=A0AAW2UH85_9LAMI